MHAVQWVARKIAGVVLVLVGIALLFLPGPGWLFIFAGAGLLGYGPHMRALYEKVRGRFEAWRLRRTAPATEK